MVELLPDIQQESDQEDIQLVQDQIDILASKYIVPVDRIRSIDNEGNRADRPIESRVHGFFRYLGFPVVANGNFYNPGFPSFQATEEAKEKINSDFETDESVRDDIRLRERDYEQRLSIFSRKDLSSATYCLLQLSVRPLNLLNEDGQSIQIEGRKQIFENLKSSNRNLNFDNVPGAFSSVESVGSTLTGVRHILRPFSLDPEIVNNVQPDSNIIAVPFLRDADSLKISDEATALRPGLELIIRERLRDRGNNEEALYLENLRNLLAGELSDGISTDETANAVSLSLIALANENQISQGTFNSLEQINVIQIYVISLLVKTVKQLTNILFQSISFIQDTLEEINWLPIVNELGPELDPRDPSTQASILENDINRNALQRRLVDLKLKKAVAEAQITDRNNLGSFASPFEINYNDTNIEELNRQIQSVSQQQAQLGEEALLALRNIEIITGEISGIGLIDILAIYIALWAVNEQSLISLLDDASFGRLEEFFPELLEGAAEARSQNGTKDDIETALTNFENTLKNVLDFAQKEFDNRSQNSGQEGGTISPQA